MPVESDRNVVFLDMRMTFSDDRRTVARDQATDRIAHPCDAEVFEDHVGRA
jgi:hypothetical protein